jgi:hypothetical protein
MIRRNTIFPIPCRRVIIALDGSDIQTFSPCEGTRGGRLPAGQPGAAGRTAMHPLVEAEVGDRPGLGWVEGRWLKEELREEIALSGPRAGEPGRGLWDSSR